MYLRGWFFLVVLIPGYAHAFVTNCKQLGGVNECLEAEPNFPEWEYSGCGDHKRLGYVIPSAWCRAQGGTWTGPYAQWCINYTPATTEAEIIPLATRFEEELQQSQSCSTIYTGGGITWGERINDYECQNLTPQYYNGANTYSSTQRLTFRGTSGADCANNWTGAVYFSRTRKPTCPKGYASHTVEVSPSNFLMKCYKQQMYYLQPSPSSCTDTEGNPCDPATGNKLQREVDLELPGTGLELVRYYQSLNSTEGYNYLGHYWRHSYVSRLDDFNSRPEIMANLRHVTARSASSVSNLHDSPTNACGAGWSAMRAQAFGGLLADATPTLVSPRLCRVSGSKGSATLTIHAANTARAPVPANTSPTHHTVSLPNGTVFRFQLIGGQWRSLDTDTDAVSLQDKGNHWIFTDKNTTQHYFDSLGRAMLRLRADGELTRFTYYPDSDRLHQVIGPRGHMLSFHYQDGSRGRIERIETPLGELRYLYDSNGNLEFAQRPDGRVRQYHYEDTVHRFHLTGITDERHVCLASWTYDDVGRVLTSVHAEGADETRFTYNSNGTTTVSDGRGAWRTYQFTLNRHVPRVSQIIGNACVDCLNGEMKSRRYDSAGRLVEYTDWHGKVTRFGNFDAKGQPAFKIENPGANARRTDYEYDPRFRGKVTKRLMPSWPLANPNGPCTEGVNCVGEYSQYDARGRVLQRIVGGMGQNGDVVGAATRYAYGGSTDCPSQPAHALCLVDGPRSDVQDITRYAYYPDSADQGANRGRLRQVINALGIPERANIQYTAFGQIASEVRPNGLRLEYDYHPGSTRLASVRQITAGSSRTLSLEYTPDGQVERMVTGGRSLTLAYDDAGRLVRITDGQGNYRAFTLDENGNPTGEETLDASGALVAQLNRTFDLQNQLNVQTDAHTRVDHTYHPMGELLRTVNGANTRTDYGYDQLQRLTTITEDVTGTPAVTRFAYDPADRPTRVTDPEGHITRYVYDALGRMVKEVSPDRGTQQYTWDAAGNLLSHTDGRNVTVHFRYDALNRRLSEDYPGTWEDITYQWDTGANGVGKLHWRQDAGGQEGYVYNPFGDITQLRRTLGSTVLVSQYRYNAGGERVQTTLVSGRTLDTPRDATGQIHRLSMTYPGQSQTLASQVNWLPFGGDVANFTYGNGLYYSAESALDGRLLGQQAGSWMQRYRYTPDTGNLSGLYQSLTGRFQLFGYDPRERVNNLAGTAVQYDRNGNRTFFGGQAYQYASNSNRLLQIGTQAPLQYNAGGMITTAHNGRHRYAYTGSGRLRTFHLDGVLRARYTYNALGQRIKKQRYNGQQA